MYNYLILFFFGNSEGQPLNGGWAVRPEGRLCVVHGVELKKWIGAFEKYMNLRIF